MATIFPVPARPDAIPKSPPISPESLRISPLRTFNICTQPLPFGLFICSQPPFFLTISTLSPTDSMAIVLASRNGSTLIPSALITLPVSAANAGITSNANRTIPSLIKFIAPFFVVHSNAAALQQTLRASNRASLCHLKIPLGEQTS